MNYYYLSIDRVAGQTKPTEEWKTRTQYRIYWLCLCWISISHIFFRSCWCCYWKQFSSKILLWFRERERMKKQFWIIGRMMMIMLCVHKQFNIQFHYELFQRFDLLLFILQLFLFLFRFLLYAYHKPYLLFQQHQKKKDRLHGKLMRKKRRWNNGILEKFH